MITSGSTYFQRFRLIEGQGCGSSVSTPEQIVGDETHRVGTGMLLRHEREFQERQPQISAADGWVVRPQIAFFEAAGQNALEGQGYALIHCLPRLPRLVQVNPSVCKALGALLRTKHIPEAHENVNVSGLLPEDVGNFFLSLVAICHQTSPRGKVPLEGFVGGQRLRGWDCLAARFREAVAADMSWLTPGRWRTASGEDIRAMFQDPILGDRLSDPEGRAALLRDLGRSLRARRWRHIDELNRYCDGRVATGYPNLLGELSRFRAYADPVRKKSLFFLSLMRSYGQWNYNDEELIGPPVDYHEVRGHLRIGTVEVIDETLRLRLYRGERVDAASDVAIRSAVYDAIMRVVELSGFSATQLHYLFWNVFRSVCTNENPQCLTILPDSTLPDRYRHLALQPDGLRTCPFAATCTSSRCDSRLMEHVLQTDYY